MSESARTVAFFILGAVSGVIITVLSAFLGGAGHGWGAAFISSFSVLSAPLAGIGWGLRGRKAGRSCAGVSLLISIAGDFALMANTAKEGSYYVERTWDALPILVIVWLILFLGWQLVALIAALAPNKPPAA